MTFATGSLSGKRIGRYRVGPLLGHGGMGEVYRADDTELGRGVALKVLPQAVVGDPDRLARFVQEARTASALNHPHLISIYEIGESRPDGVPQPVHYIAMELVVGGTLRQHFDSQSTDLRKLTEYHSAALALAKKERGVSPALPSPEPRAPTLRLCSGSPRALSRGESRR